MKKTLCIYHGNCADGFGAAWAVRHALGDNVDFHAGFYTDAPPDVTNRDVVIVDFSYPLEILEALIEMANSITIIDHHKTAEEDLKHLISEGRIKGIFDSTKSGAMLAWNWFHPGEEPPLLIAHIQDRDLWKFQMRGTREIQAAVFSFPYEFRVWDSLMGMDVDELIKEGTAIERKHFKDIHELIPLMTRRMTIAGHDVPVVNLPYIYSSDAGHILSENEPFAACYYDTKQGRCFSLRSAPNGIDVSEIAKQYGGGGHKHAAGFTVPIGWEGNDDEIKRSYEESRILLDMNRNILEALMRNEKLIERVEFKLGIK
jgi:oligoribonuclease NrnB/cAMP/cGMP phosphodiesterase (DHH superfamily)